MIGFILRLAATGLPLLILTGSAAWVSYAVVKRRRGEAPARRAILWTLLTATVATLLAWTLFLGNPSRADSDRVNLTPFREILRGVRVIGSDYGVINIWGNLLVFVPLGVLVTLLWRGRWLAGAAVAVACATGFSVAIEAAQYAVGRSSDIDDVILNTAGALVGALAVGGWRLASRAREREV